MCKKQRLVHSLTNNLTQQYIKISIIHNRYCLLLVMELIIKFNEIVINNIICWLPVIE
jgi:hypothetical protein